MAVESRQHHPESSCQQNGTLCLFSGIVGKDAGCHISACLIGTASICWNLSVCRIREIDAETTYAALTRLRSTSGTIGLRRLRGCGSLPAGNAVSVLSSMSCDSVRVGLASQHMKYRKDVRLSCFGTRADGSGGVITSRRVTTITLQLTNHVHSADKI
jgi:hypothetical protein